MRVAAETQVLSIFYLHRDTAGAAEQGMVQYTQVWRLAWTSRWFFLDRAPTGMTRGRDNKEDGNLGSRGLVLAMPYVKQVYEEVYKLI